MKFLISIAFIIASLAICQGASTPYQATLNPTMTLKDKLKQSHLGSAVLNMVNLGNQVDVDFNELFKAFEALKESLSNKEQDEYEDFDSDETLHKSEVTRLQALVNQYGAQAIQFQDELDNLISEGQDLESQLSLQEKQLEAAENQLKSEEQLLENLQNDFEKEKSDVENAVNLLDQAIGKLKQAQTSTVTSLGQFVQLNKGTILSLSQKIENLKVGKAFTQPIKQVLVQLTTGEPDSNSIKRAIDALEKLKAFYQKQFGEFEQSHNEQVQSHSNLVNSIKVQIGNLENVVIPQTQASLSANSEAKQTRTTQVTEASRNQRIEQKNLDDEKESWEKRVQEHEILIDQFAEEKEIVEQAEQLLKQQQL